MSDSGQNPLALEAALKEYEALRSEMDVLWRDASQYQNFAFVFTGASIALIDLIAKADDAGKLGLGRLWLSLPTLLCGALLFCFLCWNFVRQHREIRVTAAYIEFRIRPKVRTLCADPELWSWEEFKEKVKANAKGKTRIAEALTWVLRTSVFWLPATAAIGVSSGELLQQVVLPESAFGWWAWCIVDSVFVAVLLVSVVRFGLLGSLDDPDLPPRVVVKPDAPT